jgi:F-type H+-transporting ATPase subunit gamma
METISVAKMRKSIVRYNNNSKYFTALKKVINEIMLHTNQADHRFLKARGGDRAVFIVVASDKGLAGGYNHNVLTLASREIQKFSESTILTVGQLAREYFEYRKVPVDAEFIHITLYPSFRDAQDISDSILNMYDKGLADAVYIVYTRLENSSTMIPECKRLLPLASDEFVTKQERAAAEIGASEFFYEPSPEAIIEKLVPQYLSGLIYGCLIQSVASEHSARVLAMTNATKNATEIIDKLNVQYNRARQESITNEMIEITTGAQQL